MKYTRLFSAQRHLRIPLLSMVVIAMVVIVSFYALNAGAAEVEETFTRELPLTTSGKLAVSNQNGSITVHAWDSPKVVLDCRTVVTAANEQDARDWLKKVRVTITRHSPEKITVETERPDEEGRGMFSFFFGERPVSRVDYRIKVPRQAIMRLASVNGSLEIVGPAGQVNSNTVNGSIMITEAACPVQAETVNGQVELSFVPVFDSSAAGTWLARLSSINGSVTIRLPSGVGADITASTLNGSIHSDFHLPLEQEIVGASAAESIGGGGPEIVLETLNGSIRILESE
jgi:hypothetical protein